MLKQACTHSLDKQHWRDGHQTGLPIFLLTQLRQVAVRRLSEGSQLGAVLQDALFVSYGCCCAAQATKVLFCYSVANFAMPDAAKLGLGMCAGWPLMC